MNRFKSFVTASALAFTTLISPLMHISVIDSNAADQIRIMPIGDSITFGLGEDGGYRKYLDYTLRTKGIDFDMVGPEGKNNDSFNYNGQYCQYDGNHAGYSGFTIKQQYPIPSWGENGLLERLQKKDAVKQAQPDVVLLIIGTNDMTANRNLNDCEKDLHTLIDYILGDLSEDGVIFMGSIPEFTAYGGNPQRVGNYNSTVKKVAESYGDNVRFADIHGCLNGMADMSSDNLHPSGAGYEKMGKFWAETIEEYLSEQGGDDDSPEILHSDFENGLSGWQGRGNVSVSVSSNEAADGKSSAYVSDRTSDWMGISYALSSKRCPVGSAISVQAKLKQNSGDNVHFKMTMQYEKDGEPVYDTFAEKQAASGDWITISAPYYEIPDGENHILYFETDSSKCDFYLDEVTVMKSDGSEPPQDIIGDLDNDGELRINDLVLLQKWILKTPGAVLENWASGDLNNDNILNSTDLILMRKLLIQ